MTKKSQMKQLSPNILLYIIIILTILLALAVGYIYYTNVNHPTITNNTTNTNNITSNQTINQSTANNNSSAEISQTEAINIALQYATSHEGFIKFPLSVANTPGSVELLMYGSNPNQLEYVITIMNDDTGQLMGYVDVNANNGQVIRYYQNPK
jgi:cytoskeletal protein RodZ